MIRRCLAPLLCWFLLLALGRAGPSQDTKPGIEVPGSARRLAFARYKGRWRVSADAGQTVEDAVEHSTENLGLFTQMVARSRLLKRLAAPAWIQMELKGDVFIIQFEGAPIQDLPISGEEVLRGKLRLSVAAKAGTLVHRGAAPDGTRTNIFRLGDTPNTLTMETTVKSPRLPEAVHFILRFSKDDSQQPHGAIAH